MKRRAEFDAPACAPSELVINAPEWLPARIIEPQNVRQEAPVIASGGQKWPVAMEAGFRLTEMALIHAEGSEDPVSGKRGDGHTGASFEVPLEQDEAFARVTPALTRWV